MDGGEQLGALRTFAQQLQVRLPTRFLFFSFSPHAFLPRLPFAPMPTRALHVRCVAFQGNCLTVPTLDQCKAVLTSPAEVERKEAFLTLKLIVEKYTICRPATGQLRDGDSLVVWLLDCLQNAPSKEVSRDC